MGERYPVDRRGFPVPVEELGFNLGLSGERNNHHMNFYRKSFGRLAISQVFRDLEPFQVVMPVREHQRLHRQYSGIEVPRPNVMLDRIQDAHDMGEPLKVYDKNIWGYREQPITKDLLRLLKSEYEAL